MNYNRPFAGYDHMVQNSPYWNANCALGHPKQRMSDLSRSVLDVPVRSLRPSMADFVPCDRILLKGPKQLFRTLVTNEFNIFHYSTTELKI